MLERMRLVIYAYGTGAGIRSVAAARSADTAPAGAVARPSLSPLIGRRQIRLWRRLMNQ
ncbi:hypothetical protein ACFSKW_07215 [Nonomuraea mangrovi]|uniref:Uncharacterized protein n=1 Tax=Nonomuraea mangrovi TaxID=2316207 RepID=A0ABW4SQN2_9ACTN